MHHETIVLWPEVVSGCGDEDANVPTLQVFVRESAVSRPAVLIVPGGGYRFVSPREGEPVALRFAAAGFNAFVLSYRYAPNRHPLPLQDASRALTLIRDNAEAWSVQPDAVAVCGFSAGGHLAASLAVHHDKPFAIGEPLKQPGYNRPDALVLSYPVITSGEYAHSGSFRHLLGDTPDAAQRSLLSLEKHVSGDMPPTFLWHTAADKSVPAQNSLLFAFALAESCVPYELHIYPEGRHGLSLADKETNRESGADPHVATWFDLSVEWLQKVFGC